MNNSNNTIMLEVVVVTAVGSSTDGIVVLEVVVTADIRIKFVLELLK